MPPNPPASEHAGLNLKSPAVEPHPSGPPQHGEFGQAERGVSIASTFLSGVSGVSTRLQSSYPETLCSPVANSINAAQFIGLPFKMIDPKFYNDYMAFTKQSFAVLVTTMTQWWSPTAVHVSGDSTLPAQLFLGADGALECKFPNRIVLMANHQLYTDWLYLWWIAYTNKMAGHVYIILKESLKNIPLIGWGAQFYNFIFLARNWETDKPRFQEHLQQLSNPNDPMWLIIFPEGTNLSASTRESSRKWAAKNGIQDMRHQLLPRSTGLRFCLQNLKNSTEWLYDCTIAYEGIPPGQFGQDIYTLQSSFFEGRPPKSVNMHWRRFQISSIPLSDGAAFEVWLRNRWKEKDHYLDYFTRTGRFPATDPWKASTPTEIKNIKPAKSIEAKVKAGSWGEFLAIFAPITAFLTVLFLFYGASVGSLFSASNGSRKPLQAQETGRLENGALPASLAKKALKNARAADPAASTASGTSAGKPQYGEWDAIRKALDKKSLEGVKSFAPKAPSTENVVAGHRSFSQPGTRAATTTEATSAAAKSRAPLKMDVSNDALRTLLAKNLGKAKDSKQVAQQTLRLANGQTIKANSPETVEVKRDSDGKVRLANGLFVGGAKGATATAASSSSPVKLANGVVVGPKTAAARAKLAPQASASKAATPRPLKKSMPSSTIQPSRKAAGPLPSTVLPRQPKAPAAPTTTTSTPSLANSGPTRSTTSVATPARSATKAAPTPAKKVPPQQQKPATATPKIPAKPAAGGSGGDAAKGKGKAPGYKIPLTVQETSRGPKEKVAPRKVDAIEKRKQGGS